MVLVRQMAAGLEPDRDDDLDEDRARRADGADLLPARPAGPGRVGPRTEAPWQSAPSWQTLAAVTAAASIFLEIIVVISLKASGRLAHSDHVNRTFGSPGWIGRLFLTDHLLAFEITSIVLLIAAVGGVILGSHTRRRDAEAAA